MFTHSYVSMFQFFFCLKGEMMRPDKCQHTNQRHIKHPPPFHIIYTFNFYFIFIFYWLAQQYWPAKNTMSKSGSALWWGAHLTEIVLPNSRRWRATVIWTGPYWYGHNNTCSPCILYYIFISPTDRRICSKYGRNIIFYTYFSSFFLKKRNECIF